MAPDVCRDNDRRGGDFDFYIETDLTDADLLFDRKLKLLVDLHASPAFADEKIDLLVRGHLPGPWPPIYEIARRDSLPPVIQNQGPSPTRPGAARSARRARSSR